MLGLIVQISSVSTPSMDSMAEEIRRALTVWVSNYATRPSCLFEGVTMNLSIILSQGTGTNSTPPTLFSTNYLRWTPDCRPWLFQTLNFTECVNKSLFKFAIPKLTATTEARIYSKLAAQAATIGHFLEQSHQATKEQLFYRTAGGRYFKIFIDRPFGSESKSNKSKCFRKGHDRYVMIAVLSSNLWWWYYTLHFDMYNCKDYMMFNFPFDYNACGAIEPLSRLGKRISSDQLANAERKLQNYASTGEREQLIFRPALSKPIADDIDTVLAAHYSLTPEELDFIINYDIKYRVAVDADIGD